MSWVICAACGFGYSMALKRPGDKCGDLSYARGTVEEILAAQPCAGVVHRRAWFVKELAELRSIIAEAEKFLALNPNDELERGLAHWKSYEKTLAYRAGEGPKP